MTNKTSFISMSAERLEERYNPEHDIIPGAPEVTYTEMELIGMIKRLVIVIEDLQEQIDRHLDTHH